VEKLRQSHDRIGFFSALATSLATETRTLAFLDAANCGEDQDGGMPSWVPTWSREVAEPAYSFAIRKNRKDQVLDRFSWTDGGATLMVLGRPRGTVHVVRSVAGPDGSAPSHYQVMFERWLALPLERKRSLSQLLAFLAGLRVHPGGSADPEETVLVLRVETRLRDASVLESGKRRLEAGGNTLVYSFDKRAREMGFLRAGEAKKGDRIVLVSGCYHHLVLRRQPGAESTSRFRLAGLIEMGEPESRVQKSSEAEWAAARARKQVFRYSIV
jgi:hypothetical protein